MVNREITTNNHPLKGYLFAMTAVLIWSGFILVSRQGGLSALTAYDIIAIRYLTCAAILTPIWFWLKPFNLLNPKLIISSLIGALLYALFAFNGFQTTPASHTAILLPGLLPVLVALFSAGLLKERLQWTRLAGIAIISSGIALLFFQQVASNQLTLGHAWVIMAGVCWAFYSVLLTRWQINPWQATASLAIITCVIYLPVYILFLPKTIGPDTLMLLFSGSHDTDVAHSALVTEILRQAIYQGILATIIQMLCYVQAVKLIGPSNMGSMMAIVPIISGLGAVLIFDEAFNSVLLITLILVSLGVWLANRKATNLSSNRHTHHSNNRTTVQPTNQPTVQSTLTLEEGNPHAIR